MKKAIKAAFVVAVAAVIGYNVYENQQADTMSDLMLANVEALADEEITSGIWVVTVYSPSHWDCTPNGGASCPGTPW